MKAVKKLVLCAFLCFAALQPAGSADLSLDLNAAMQGAFDAGRVYGHVDGPSAFTAQGRGYATGGSLTVRTKSATLTPVNIQLPRFDAGCGGIDLHLGSISFASGEEYLNFFKALPAAAGGYALKVGLNAISPTLADAFDKIEEVVNKINNLSINSCEAAKALVDGTVGLIAGKDESSCMQRKQLLEGVGPARARQLCRQAMAIPASGEADTAPTRPLEGNLVWNAMSKKLTGLSKLEKQLFMSLVGTVVIHPRTKETESDREGIKRVDPFGPTIFTFSQFYNGEAEGWWGSPTMLKMYDCGEDDACMNPTPTDVSVKTFPTMVEERLRNIVANLVDGKPQKDADIGFINSTSFPVFRMLVLATANGDATVANSLIDNYKDIIAIEIAQAYIDKIVAQGSAILQTSKVDASSAELQLLNGISTIAAQFKEGAQAEQRKYADKIKSRSEFMGEMERLQRTLYGQVPENVRRLAMAR
ncbi:conjugal transfer protein TraH [Ramlibacter humi]|uniref:Conjugal transfer protein TraH n=1 Tax=Ramlibacter humi TaxID=2530451 RepID=A0A4Z0BL70_9BURK|nr:conjugal transfer protein TraH [Ramlibacter humi]TFZ00077.1 hypothetical protein EZ216_13280 [Ramlibacter humi]